MEHTDHLEAHAVDRDVVAQRPLVLAEQLTLDAGADDRDFAALLLIQCVKRAPLIDLHCHDAFDSGKTTLNGKGAVFGFVHSVSGRSTPQPDGVLPLDHADTG